MVQRKEGFTWRQKSATSELPNFSSPHYNIVTADKKKHENDRLHSNIPCKFSHIR